MLGVQSRATAGGQSQRAPGFAATFSSEALVASDDVVELTIDVAGTVTAGFYQIAVYGESAGVVAHRATIAIVVSPATSP